MSSIPLIFTLIPTLSNWLRSVNPNIPVNRFQLEVFEENANPSIIDKNSLKILVIESIIGCTIVQNSLGKNKAQKTRSLVESRLPTLSKIRKGDFGEVLFGFILEEYSNFILPIKKLQHRLIPNSSPPRADIIALKLNGNYITEICFGEAKLVTTPTTSIITDAYVQLKNEYSDMYSDMLGFLLIHIDENSPCYGPFLDYMHGINSNIVHEVFAIGIVSEASVWSDTAVRNMDTKIDPNCPETRVVLVKVNDLTNLVDEIFDNIGDVLS